MKKKQIILGVVGAALLGAGAFFGTHISVDGEFFPKNQAVLDLTEHALSVEDYLSIQKTFPEKEILWEVPFQGSRYPADTAFLTLHSLTEEEVVILDHLPQLTVIDASQCADLSALQALQARHPGCLILHPEQIGGARYDSVSQELILADADPAPLEAQLPWLPQLRTLTLEGTLPNPEALLQLQSAFPSLAVRYPMTIAGMDFSSDIAHLDLSNTTVTLQELEEALPYLSNVTELDLTGTALTEDEKKALIDQYPEIFILCTLDFAGKPFPTDSTEIDISGCPITVEETEALLPYFPKLSKLIMSHCGIENEAMDALNQRYPDISIVWTLQIGRVTVRTDDTVFYPASVHEFDLPSNEEMQKLRYCTEMVAIDIGHSKATDCEWVRFMPHLKYLIIADTKITDLSPLSNAKELVFLEVFRLEIEDYSPLLGCTALQDLNIGMTYADPEPLSKMTWLHTLMWHDAIEVPELRDAAYQLAETLSDTYVILETWRNVSDVWRYLPNYYAFRDLIGGDFFNQEYILKYWGKEDGKRINDCDGGNPQFVGEVLAEIIQRRIEEGQSIPGIKNVGSEKAEILYQSLMDLHP